MSYKTATAACRAKDDLRRLIMDECRQGRRSLRRYSYKYPIWESERHDWLHVCERYVEGGCRSMRLALLAEGVPGDMIACIKVARSIYLGVLAIPAEKLRLIEGKELRASLHAIREQIDWLQIDRDARTQQ